MKPEAVAILDIGKTNKKCAVFSRDLRALAERRISLDAAPWEGLEIERTPELLAWLRESLTLFAIEYDVRAIAVCAHGATLALLDRNGGLAAPVISYTSQVDLALHEEFYREFGSPAALHRATASPDLGFVNMAKTLYYVRSRMPERWATVRHGLFYAPYIAFELTGRRSLEPTFVGNHSYLWDFARKDWSEVARKLGADTIFGGPLRAPWDALGPLHEDWARDCGIGPECRVAVGIHDSNANLLPYLIREKENFVLASTGTWCVLMRPAPSPHLSDAQIDAGIFLNQSAFAQPVLTGLIPAGMEYETFAGFAPFPDTSDESALARIVAEHDVFVIPGSLPGVPVFPGARPGLIVGKERYSLDDLRAGHALAAIAALGQRYFAALNLALALATRRALEHLQAPRGSRVYIEGGFASNTLYCRLLATLCPEFDWALTHTKEGTSLGAALCAWAAAESRHPRDLDQRYSVDTTSVEQLDVSGLAKYAHDFDDLLKQSL